MSNHILMAHDVYTCACGREFLKMGKRSALERYKRHQVSFGWISLLVASKTLNLHAERSVAWKFFLKNLAGLLSGNQSIQEPYHLHLQRWRMWRNFYNKEGSTISRGQVHFGEEAVSQVQDVLQESTLFKPPQVRTIIDIPIVPLTLRLKES